ERYCGSLQPAIRNCRYPYSSLNRHALDHARLKHIVLLYNLRDKLTFRPSSDMTGVVIPAYTTCVLLAPCRPITLDTGLLLKITSCLATRYGATPAAICAAVSRDAQQWGKLRILNDGDTIRASKMQVSAADGCDASYVRYELLVDKNARYRNRPVILQKKTFVGQLQHILVVEVAAIPSANLPQLMPSTLLLGVVQQCLISDSQEILNIHYYKKLGHVEVVDISTVQCVVGRVKLGRGGEFAVIDRSGTLTRAVYMVDE
ncbi:hypothetical protein C8Q77DRAFT_1056771, partial [Trametes polyzona]